MPPKKAPKKAAKKADAKETKSTAKAPGKRGAAVARKGDRKAVDVSGSWPVDPATGLPLIQISFTASELIPTGEYANVTVGPVTVTKFIVDPEDDTALADELNDLAEVVEANCISEQRELVMKSLQADAE